MRGDHQIDNIINILVISTNNHRASSLLLHKQYKWYTRQSCQAGITVSVKEVYISGNVRSLLDSSHKTVI